ncbi:MAG: YihY/virulence factor BrkB family protein [Pseudobdellovibrionaceae bacterium]
MKAALKSRFGEFFGAMGDDRIFMLGGSIAYTVALALAPFVIILLAFASLLGQGFQSRMYEQLTQLMGPEAGKAVQLVVESADNNQSITTISGLVGLMVLAVSASAVFGQIRSALDIMNHTPEEKIPSGIKGFFKDKAFSLGLVFGFVFLSIASLAVTAIISGIFYGREEVLWSITSALTNLALFWGLFTLLFRFTPTERMPWRNCAVSGICAAVFYLTGKSAIGMYLGNASVGSAYGAAGTFVVFLVWVYYTTVTLLISYEFSNHILIGDHHGKEKEKKVFKVGEQRR